MQVSIKDFFFFFVFWTSPLANLTFLCCRQADSELVPHVLSSAPNRHHRSVHLLRPLAGASPHGEPQSLGPQGSPHCLQFRRSGALALHVLRGESCCLLRRLVDSTCWNPHRRVSPSCVNGFLVCKRNVTHLISHQLGVLCNTFVHGTLCLVLVQANQICRCFLSCIVSCFCVNAALTLSMFGISIKS